MTAPPPKAPAGTPEDPTPAWTALDSARAQVGQLEAELIQAQKMESIGRLAGGVAHDFNNMLGVILGQAEVAMMMPGSQPFHPFLGEIVKAARRSGELTRQLLAFARRQAVSPQAVDLNGTIQGMVKMLGRLLGEGIALSWTRKEGLWEVWIDPAQIDQILANLAVNARDACAGAGTLAIALDNVILDEAFLRDHPSAAQGEFVLLTVADSGAGMGPEVLRHLFEPFFTTKEPGVGSGLGLATVFGIVKQNGGFILVRSRPGEGAEFRIYLPRRRQEPVHAGGDAPGGRGRTILLVEDEAALLASTQLLLEQLGYRVVPAPGPREALARAEDRRDAFDLLLTDVVMPGMNGLELSERIQGLRPGLPVLFMSGYTADILVPKGILDGHVHFLQKPASRADLGRCVGEILGA